MDRIGYSQELNNQLNVPEKPFEPKTPEVEPDLDIPGPNKGEGPDFDDSGYSGPSFGMGGM